jgi:hypothetical protein
MPKCMAFRYGSRTVNICGAVNTQYTGHVACRGLLSLSDATPSWLRGIGRRPSPPASGQHGLTKTYDTGVIRSPVRSLPPSLREEWLYRYGRVLIAWFILPAEKCHYPKLIKQITYNTQLLFISCNCYRHKDYSLHTRNNIMYKIWECFLCLISNQWSRRIRWLKL